MTLYRVKYKGKFGDIKTVVIEADSIWKAEHLARSMFNKDFIEIENTEPNNNKDYSSLFDDDCYL